MKKGIIILFIIILSLSLVSAAIGDRGSDSTGTRESQFAKSIAEEDLIPINLIVPVMVGIIIAIIVISYKLGLLKILLWPFILIGKLFGFFKDVTSIASSNLKSSGSLLGSFKSALERGESESSGEAAVDPLDQKVEEDTKAAEGITAELGQELAKGPQADPNKIQQFKESARSTLENLSKEIKQEDDNFILLKKQYAHDLKLSRKSISVTKKQLRGEKTEKEFVSKALESLKGSEFKNNNLIGEFNNVIEQATKSEEQVAAYSNEISAMVKILVQQASQRQSLSKELVNIVEKANKKIKDNLTEESVQEVQTLLAQIKEKKILISSFRTNIEKLDNQKQILLKNLFRSGANATELMKKQKDLVERLNSLVNAAKLAKEKMKKAKSAA